MARTPRRPARPGGSRPAGRADAPLPQAPPSTGLRAEVERVSSPLLRWLTGLPRFVVPIATVLLLAVGVLAPVPVGVAALVVVLLWMAWLAYLSWPVVTTGARVLRLATVGLLAVAIVVRLAPGA